MLAPAQLPSSAICIGIPMRNNKIRSSSPLLAEEPLLLFGAVKKIVSEMLGPSRCEGALERLWRGSGAVLETLWGDMQRIWRGCGEGPEGVWARDVFHA